MEWFWEPRSDANFTPPQIATLWPGWTSHKADMKSEVPRESEVFTREVIQNFVDAAREEHKLNPNNPSQKPTLTFRFLELSGADAKALAKNIDLTSISERYSKIDDGLKKDMRLEQTATILGKHDKVRLLVVSEANTCGMYGEWHQTDQVYDAQGKEIASRMRDALLATVRGSAGKGLGAFGEGKKAVIGISAPRTLFAYTCFDPTTSSDRVSRRFMGGVYWQPHIYKNQKFSGFAMIGAPKKDDDVRPEPLADSAADSAVMALQIPGLDVRDPVNGKGTTYVFVDHVTSPREIAVSIARNWWPLIEDGGAKFRVIRENGTEEPIAFDANLKPFIDAYQASGSAHVSDWTVAEEKDLALQVSTLVSSVDKKVQLGDLKLAIDLRNVVGWSRKDPDNNTSIVALIRDGMVLTYQHFPKTRKLAAPFVRGSFTVSSSRHPVAEDLLRSVEPPLHNKWQDDNKELDPEAKRAARDVYSLITDAVKSFREQYLSSTPTEEQNFEIFSENLTLSGGRRVVGPTPLPAPKTPWSMLSEKAEIIDNKDGRRYATASRTIKLAKAGLKPHRVRVKVGWEIQEDNRNWVEAGDFMVSPVLATKGWELVKGEADEFEGLVQQEQAVFTWESRPYRELWTLRPFMRVTSLEIATVESEVK